MRNEFFVLGSEVRPVIAPSCTDQSVESPRQWFSVLPSNSGLNFVLTVGGRSPNAWTRSVPTKTAPFTTVGSLYLPLGNSTPGELFHKSSKFMASKAYKIGCGA